jgi:hypothetical protein
LIGVTIFLGFTQFTTVNSLQTQNSNLQSQISQLQAQNAMLNANNTALYSQIRQLQGLSTEKTGKAIQIQSARYNPSSNLFSIDVQNIGDSDVQFPNNQSVSLNSVLVNSLVVTGLTDTFLQTGSIATIAASASGLSSGTQSVTVKVTTLDGTTSQITQQFTISSQAQQTQTPQTISSPTPLPSASSVGRGKAIQIQNVTYAGGVNDTFTIYVQNVGDSEVRLLYGQCIYINNVLLANPNFEGGITVPAGFTATLTATVSGLKDGLQSIVIKVVTSDGSFSEVTQQFTIS